MIKAVNLVQQSGGGWTVYVEREDGLQMSVAYSQVYPGVSGESMVAAWQDFLGIAPEPTPVVPDETVVVE